VKNHCVHFYPSLLQVEGRVVKWEGKGKLGAMDFHLLHLPHLPRAAAVASLSRIERVLLAYTVWRVPPIAREGPAVLCVQYRVVLHHGLT
jgi:hypothetical protein